MPRLITSPGSRCPATRRAMSWVTALKAIHLLLGRVTGSVHPELDLSPYQIVDVRMRRHHVLRVQGARLDDLVGLRDDDVCCGSHVWIEVTRRLVVSQVA